MCESPLFCFLSVDYAYKCTRKNVLAICSLQLHTLYKWMYVSICIYTYIYTYRHSVAVVAVNKLLQLLYYLRYIYICYRSCKNYSYCITYAIYTCMSARIYTYTYMYIYIKLAFMRAAAVSIYLSIEIERERLSHTQIHTHTHTHMYVTFFGLGINTLLYLNM